MSRKENYDVVLISPMEISLREDELSRDNKIIADIDNYKKSKINALYLKQFRENIGIGSLAAYLRLHGLKVKIINCNIERLDAETVIEDIMDINPYVIGISMLYDLHVFNGFKIADRLKEKGFNGHITAGGAFATLSYQQLLRNMKAIDSIIRGEGETAFLQLTRKIIDGTEWRDTSGIAYRDGEKITANKCTEYIKDLSTLPFVSRDSLNYLHENGVQVRVASIYSSRGCKGNCTYCTAPHLSMLYEEKWRYRSANHVVDEIEELVKKYGINYFYFCDDNFFGYGKNAVKRLEDMAQEIIKRELKISFHAEVRVDNKIDENLLKLLKKSGLKDVLVGIESGSQSVLNRWRKGTTVKQNLNTVRSLRSLGFNVEPAMILVDSFTTIDELCETVEFIKEAELFKAQYPLHMFNKMIVFTETNLYKSYLEEGIIKESNDNWEKNDDFYESLLKVCRQVSYSDYRIQNSKIEVMWDILMKFVNKLSQLIEEYFPTYTEELVVRSRAETNEKRKEYLKKIHAVKNWRRDIGNISLELLEKSCLWLKGSAEASELINELQEAIKEYHMTYFKSDNYEVLIEDIMRLSTYEN